MKAMKNLMLASLLIGLGACSNHEQDVLDASKYITVDAGFGTDSRVATNGLASVFEENDAIGVYAWTGGNTLPSNKDNFQVYNVANTYDGTNWTAEKKMWWKDDTSHYFLSVYPATDILTTTTYTLNLDDQEQSDLLIATNFGENKEGIAPQSNPVPLAFGHVMAKLRVNIMFNDELSDSAPSVSKVIAKAKDEAIIDWQNATAEATGNATDIELPKLSTATHSYESVMVPQDGFQCVDVIIGGKTYTFNYNKDIPLIKGNITTLNLIVGRSSVVVGGATIEDWTLNGVVDGTIRFLPEYSDGKVKIEPGMTSVDLAFIVSPKKLVKNEVKAFIYHTKSRAVDAPQPLTVTGVSGDETTGMLTVSVTPPAEEYWATGKTANIYIQINDGNNDIISEMIPAYYYVEPDYVTFSAASEQTLDLVQTKSQKLDESGYGVYEDDEVTPVLVPNPYPGSGDDHGCIEYSVGNSNVWKMFTPESEAVTFGGDWGDLHLRGISPKGTLKAQIVFGNNTPVACSGDIRTLVDWKNYETADTRSAIFYGLFKDCTVLKSAPELPATNLADQCYWSMFWGCTSLAEAPELPATTLANSCYVNMFQGCTSLSSAPVLKAAMLVEDCYNGMFTRCSNLNSVTMLATNITATDCLDSWLLGVANSGTFTKAEGMTAIPTNSVSGIPTGWTVKVKSVEQEQETLPGFNYVNGY